MDKPAKQTVHAFSLSASFLLAFALLAMAMGLVLPLFITVLAIISFVCLLGATYGKQQGVGRILFRSNSIIKYSIFLAGVLYIVVTTTRTNQLQATTTFVYVCFLAKCFELASKRDRMIAIFFGLFTLSLVFLFTQALFKTVFILFCLLSWFLVLKDEAKTINTKQLFPQNIHPFLSNAPASLRADITTQGLWSTLNKQLQQLRQGFVALLMVLGIAIPLIILLYLFFPRFEPLWHIQLGGEKIAKTGITDRLNMGDIGELSQSFEPAFSAHFSQKQDVPAVQSRYFRAVVLGVFNGAGWQRIPEKQQFKSLSLSEAIQDGTWFRHRARIDHQLFDTQGVTQYTVTQEPNAQPWIFSLQGSVSRDSTVVLTPEYTLQSRDDIEDESTFNLALVHGLGIDAYVHTDDAWLARYVQLPVASNPRAQQFAQQLWQQAAQQPDRFVQLLSQYIYAQNYRYTLKPPVLTTANKIDEFWFTQQAGFCEHYASSAAFLLRSVGIPARVVGGYLGGELQPDGLTLNVKQMDAHAWVEYWQVDKGWTLFDPTAAVSPLRVEQGMAALGELSSTFGNGVAGELGYRRFQLLKQLNLWADRADAFWQQDVVGYDRKQQQGFFDRHFGINSALSILMWFMGVLFTLAAIFYVWLWWSGRRFIAPLHRALLKLEHACGAKIKMATSQQPPNYVPMSQGFNAWCASVLPYLQGNTAATEQLMLIQQHINQLLYAPAITVQSKHEKRDLERHLINEIRQLIKRAERF